MAAMLVPARQDHHFNKKDSYMDWVDVVKIHLTHASLAAYTSMATSLSRRRPWRARAVAAYGNHQRVLGPLLSWATGQRGARSRRRRRGAATRRPSARWLRPWSPIVTTKSPWRDLSRRLGFGAAGSAAIAAGGSSCRARRRCTAARRTSWWATQGSARL